MAAVGSLSFFSSVRHSLIVGAAETSLPLLLFVASSPYSGQCSIWQRPSFSKHLSTHLVCHIQPLNADPQHNLLSTSTRNPNGTNRSPALLSPPEPQRRRARGGRHP